jgi:hypothetical protein
MPSVGELGIEEKKLKSEEGGDTEFVSRGTPRDVEARLTAVGKLVVPGKLIEPPDPANERVLGVNIEEIGVGKEIWNEEIETPDDNDNGIVKLTPERIVMLDVGRLALVGTLKEI